MEGDVSMEVPLPLWLRNFSSGFFVTGFNTLKHFFLKGEGDCICRTRESNGDKLSTQKGNLFLIDKSDVAERMWLKPLTIGSFIK